MDETTQATIEGKLMLICLFDDFLMIRVHPQAANNLTF